MLPNKEQQDRLYREERNTITVYNWALKFSTAWMKAVREGKLETKPNRFRLIKAYTAFRRTNSELLAGDASSQQQAVMALWKAKQNFWDKKTNAPTEHFMGHTGSFKVVNNHGHITKNGTHMYVPKVGYIKLTEKPKFSGKIFYYTVTREGFGKEAVWYVSIAYALTERPKYDVRDIDKVLGVDVGVANLCTDSDGIQYHMPDVSDKERRRRHYQKMLARSMRGSNRHKRIRNKLERTSRHIKNIKQDTIHKVSRTIAAKAGHIVIETLSLQKMYKSAPGKSLRRSLHQADLSELLRQIDYKALDCIKAARYFASTQICSGCGHSHKPALSDRTYTCPHCGLVIDRDLNAAINLRNYGISKLIQAGHACSMPLMEQGCLARGPSDAVSC